MKQNLATRARHLGLLGTAAVMAVLAPAGAAHAAGDWVDHNPVVHLVSVDSTGVQSNSYSEQPSISADGRYVAYRSYASNLVPGDTNDRPDVFVYDRSTRQTTRVSVTSTGEQGFGYSTRNPVISGDGRYVAFQTDSRLVPEDTTFDTDVYVYDRTTRTTTLASPGLDGKPANRAAARPAISADGQYVSFVSAASNLVINDTNDRYDTFVYDLTTRQTSRVSVSTTGDQANGDSRMTPAVSADGRYVAYSSSASNLVPGDTNGSTDVFVHDLATQVTTRASLGTGGAEILGSSDWPSISADGRYVAFMSQALNIVPGDWNSYQDLFVYDRQSAQVSKVTNGVGGAPTDGHSGIPSISADGRLVAFDSAASNLVADDTNGRDDVFTTDLSTGVTTRVSMTNAGVQATDSSSAPSLSGDGRYVAYTSGAWMAPADHNGYPDVFVFRRP
jgi:Tol biopolymer transport system component